MATPGIGQRQYSFGEFTLDVDGGALRKGSDEVRLRRQSFEVLRYLLEHHGRLVSKKELLDSVWGDTVVTDGSLTQCVIDVRRAIGDDARQTIRTLPRRGYVFAAPVIESPSSHDAIAPSQSAGRDTRGSWPLAAGAVLLLAAAAAWWLLPFDSPAETDQASRLDHIAVLPFADMSEAGDHGYFSDGIAEEILNLLAESPDLHVIARTSSFTFRGEDADIATIAEKLGVAHVLQGSVRRSDNRLRITSQLIETATSTEVWSDSYEREVGDVLVLQSEIAAAVAVALKATLSVDAVTPPAESANAEAYERYLQGRLFHNRRAQGDAERAEEYFRQALEIDATYGRAWAGLAGVYFVRMAEDNSEKVATLAAWKEAVEQALRYAPEDPEVQLRAAHFYWNNGQRDTARKHVRQATVLDPNNPLVLAAWAGSNVFHGRLDEAIARQRQVVALDPLGAIEQRNLAVMLAGAGRYDEALSHEQKALDLNPAYRPEFERLVSAIFTAQGRFEEALEIVRRWPAGGNRDRGLGLIYHGLGRSSEATAALENLTAGTDADAAFAAAEVYGYRGELDEAFKWLHTCLDRANPYGREAWMTEARLSPFLVTLHDDPRWEKTLVHSH